MAYGTFYRCEKCGAIVYKINTVGKIFCCGQPMVALTANTVEASMEKHLPVVEINDNMLTATVGSTIHPMEEKHFIEWICVKTEDGIFAKSLKPGEEPRATFPVTGEKPVSVLEYCNLHGLWETVL